MVSLNEEVVNGSGRELREVLSPEALQECALISIVFNS